MDNFKTGGSIEHTEFSIAMKNVGSTILIGLGGNNEG